MIEELKDEELVNKVGGRFRLATLIQKRLVHLNQLSPAGTESGGEKKDKLQQVIQEIVEDRIYLDINGNVAIKDLDGTEMGDPANFSQM